MTQTLGYQGYQPPSSCCKKWHRLLATRVTSLRRRVVKNDTDCWLPGLPASVVVLYKMTQTVGYQGYQPSSSCCKKWHRLLTARVVSLRRRVVKNHTDCWLPGIPACWRQIIGSAKRNCRFLFTEVIVLLATFSQFEKYLAK